MLFHWSLDPLSLILVTSALGFSLFRLIFISWGIFNFGYFGCPWVINTDFIDVLSLISLDPLSLILVTSALGFSLFRLIFTCILGYLQFWLFWLCPWVINIDFIDVLSLISLDPLSLILVTFVLGFLLFHLIFTCTLGIFSILVVFLDH